MHLYSAYSFKYDEDSPYKLERVFDEWTEIPMFLNDFFEKKDITISIEVAIRKVNNEALFLRNKLIKLAK